MSPPEGMLWRLLRGRPEGFKFRRQHPIGRCIVDFYCPAASLVVEIDGISHDLGSNPAHDLRRDMWLRGQDLHVLRFSATDVINDPGSVVKAITLACRR